jgi:hypothetical protein
VFNGQSTNSSRFLKSKGGNLSARATVLTYVRGNKEWRNNASPVTPEQVKAIRQKVASRSTSWSPDELLKVPENE